MTTAAEFGVFCPGMLEVLSIGKGDLKLEVTDSPEDRQRAKDLIGEMLRKGYSIFVETEDGPVRVMGFIDSRMTYVIEDVADEPPTKSKAGTRSRGRPRRTEVPVSGSRATAVGRTAGG